MSTPDGIWFVYRSHAEGPLSKRVRRLPATSVLTWFQAQIEEARISAAPANVADAALGGPVYGFGALFAAAHEKSLHTPKTSTALRKVLAEHLHVEGEDHIQLDNHTLRVLTDDDEVALAYVFFDDEAAKRSPDRTAWLLHEEPSLPEGDADGAFSPPVEVPALLPGGGGEGATYAALFTFYDSDSLPGTVAVFPGVRLPGLAAHLRDVLPDTKSPSAEWLATWPVEIRLLRAMLDAGDTTLAPALHRASAYPLGAIAGHDAGKHSHPGLGTGELSTARAQFLAAAEGVAHGGDPSKSIVHEGAHAALLAAHGSTALGFQQWLFFDDRWAAAHPDLAASILRYGRQWDPFAVTKGPKEAKGPSKSKGSKSANGSGAKSTREPKAAKEPKAVRAARVAGEAAATKHDHLWKSAVAGRTEGEARAYAPGEQFVEGELINHARFGLGVVTRVVPTKIEALFSGTPRILVHGSK